MQWTTFFFFRGSFWSCSLKCYFLVLMNKLGLRVLEETILSQLQWSLLVKKKTKNCKRKTKLILKLWHLPKHFYEQFVALWLSFVSSYKWPFFKIFVLWPKVCLVLKFYVWNVGNFMIPIFHTTPACVYVEGKVWQVAPTLGVEGSLVWRGPVWMGRCSGEGSPPWESSRGSPSPPHDDDNNDHDT